MNYNDYDKELERINQALMQVIQMRKNAYYNDPADDATQRILVDKVQEIGRRLEVVAFVLDRYYWSSDGRKLCNN